MSPRCQHTRTERGKDIPLRWGSHRSEVCLDCGMFRQLGPRPLPWRPAEEYQQATEDRDDE